MKKPLHTFCSHCGSRLKGELVGAENYRTYEYGDCYCPHTHTRFNRDTGLRQYVIHYFCPLRKFIFNPHDDFMEEELFFKKQ